MSAERPREIRGGQPVAGWALLYRAGAIAAWLFVALLVAAIVLAVATPPPPTASGAATLEYIAAHRTLYLVHQQLWLLPGAFAAVVYLALYPALKPLHPSVAALGCAVGGIAWALTLAMPTTSTGAPALVYLSDQYAAASDPAQRAAFVAAAEGLIALNRTPTAVGVLTTVGMLIVSVVMLRGVFPRWVAFLGIATGLLGVASEALRPVIEGGYAAYGVLLLVWTGAVGWRLYRHGAHPSRGSLNEQTVSGRGRSEGVGGALERSAASARDAGCETDDRTIDRRGPRTMAIEYSFEREIEPDALRRLFRQTTWARERTLEGIATMLAPTPVKLGVWHGGQLIGFARAMSDAAYKAYIDDVVVDEGFRSQGIGTEIVRRLTHRLEGVEVVFLNCGERLVPFYAKLGFGTRKGHTLFLIKSPDPRPLP